MTTTPTSLGAEALAHLQSWQGRMDVQQDQVTAAPMQAMSATLDRDDPLPMAGAALPPLWHWLYFLPKNLHREIGPDGHPHRGGFLPPVPLPRRMWAGSQLTWNTNNPLRVGDALERTSRIVSVTPKLGRTGAMVFVQVEHVLCNGHGVALTELHDIVYRDAPRASDPAPQPTASPTGAPWQREVTPNEVMLFRYSALTFNGHRIHYDRSYVTQVEGYPGLVVHGPLIATLLLDLLQRQAPSAVLKSYTFKALRPCFDGRVLRVNGEPSPDGKRVSLWAQDVEAWLAMSAEVTLA